MDGSHGDKITNLDLGQMVTDVFKQNASKDSTVRNFTISVEPKSGHLHDIDITIGNAVVVSGDGSKKREYKGEISDAEAKITVWIVGVPGSQYSITVDLPGKANDFEINHILSTTMQKVSFFV